MTGKEIGAILLKRIDVKGLIVEDLLTSILEPALKKIVEDSSNPYDDVAMAALYPPLKKALQEQIENLLNKVIK